MERYLQKEYNLYLENRPGFYTIMEIIGQGASTVAYLAEYQDHSGHVSKHILKEFNPSYIEFNRDENGAICYSTKDKDRFDSGLERFRSGCNRQYEIRNYERMNNQTPPLEGPYDANNTTYLDVANYVGTTLDQAISEMSIMDRMKTCLSIAKLIQCYHNAGYLCLDIKPQNVFVLPETKELLQFIDYDSVFKKNELGFGNSISYTKSWSAPEQLNPYRWSEVSEQSDIYAIGELIFWSVFERHSDVSEHRAFSSYPYEESRYAAIISEQASELFDELFHKTIRTSANHRYSSAENVIDVLSKIIEGLTPDKMQIVKSQIYPRDFFVGRDVELQEIKQLLDDNSVVFISGMGGIGKSELVRQYIKQYGDKYRNILYWTYSENLEKMICQDESVSVSNFNRVKEETDHNYCWRKLKKIKELLKDDNLIVIDNLDVKVEDLEYPEIWRYLLTFQGHFLITTRCNESDYKQIRINELSEMESVKEIFSHYCAYEAEQDIYVQEIIDSVDRSTLAVELLAKQTKAAFLSPEEMLNKLRSGGLGEFDNNKISLLKDGISESASIKNHIEKIFSVASMTDDRKILLTQLAFMPVTGIKRKIFSVFFNADQGDLYWLIENGWINCSEEKRPILTIHPMISVMIIDQFKNNINFNEELFNLAIMSMRKYRITFSNYPVFSLICDSIAATGKRYNLQNEYFANYIVQYISRFVKYGRLDAKKELIEYAINIYSDNEDENNCVKEKEMAYCNYIIVLLNMNILDINIKKLCEERLSIALKEKDYMTATIWSYSIALMDILKIGNEEYTSFCELYRYVRYIKYYIDYLINSNLFKKNIEKTPPYAALYLWSYMLDLYIDYFNKSINYGNSNDLKTAQKIILSYKHIVKNFSEEDISINEKDIILQIVVAKIKVLEKDFGTAKRILYLIIQLYKDKKIPPTINIYNVYKLLGEIEFTNGAYDKSETFFKECLKISKVFINIDDYSVRIRLGQIYNVTARITLAEKYNKKLLDDLLDINSESKKHLLAEVYYNLGEMYFVQGDNNLSWQHLSLAIKNFKEKSRFPKYSNVGIARCFEIFIQISLKEGEISKADTYYKKACEFYEFALGPDHPETIACKEKYIITDNNRII